MTQKTPQEALKAMEEISSQPPLAETPAPLVAASNISPDGLRAARALLDWSRDKLKETAGVSVEAIKSIEGGFFKPKKETHDKLTTTFSGEGVEFIEINALTRYGLNITGVLRIAVTKPEDRDEGKAPVRP
jgi:DNA-binding XRE family transcriptional regulator